MNGNIKNIRTKQGYTLIELIVVLALLSLLLSICVPSISIIGKFKEKEEIDSFRRDIVSTRNKAIMEGFAYNLKIEEPNNTYIITKDGKVIKEVEFAYWQVKNNFEKNSFKLLPTGSPDQGGSIWLTNKKGKVTKLTLVPVTGKVNVYEN